MVLPTSTSPPAGGVRCISCTGHAVAALLFATWAAKPTERGRGEIALVSSESMQWGRTPPLSFGVTVLKGFDRTPLATSERESKPVGLPWVLSLLLP